MSGQLHVSASVGILSQFLGDLSRSLATVPTALARSCNINLNQNKMWSNMLRQIDEAAVI